MTSKTVQRSADPAVRKLGIVGGLGALAGADLFYKLMKSRAVLDQQACYHFSFEQHPFKDLRLTLDAQADMSARKFYAYQVCRSFEQNGTDALLLPCFASHTFLEEIQAELGIPILNMMAALREHLLQRLPQGATVGVLASDFVRHSGLFERYLGGQLQVVYPDATAQAGLMAAVYGPQGIKAGHLQGLALEGLYQAALSLQAQGVSLIAPGMTELALVCADLQRRGVALLDINEVYAQFATRGAGQPPRPGFKLGVLGGVGPAATVDFMAKIVANTPAGKDQDHIKLVVEQNPQIPDRTANLLQGETDPSLALYATCKRLESAGADAIAIPCNTAHAFVARIQAHLRIPVVNMLDETLAAIVRDYGVERPLGLLATSGTLQSQVYHEAARRAGLQVITPGHEYQALVMEAIYGARGIKAGFTEGICQEQLLVVAEHLCDLGAGVLILGCTELPLVLAHSPAFSVGAHRVALVDPTTILALKCVELALAAREG